MMAAALPTSKDSAVSGRHVCFQDIRTWIAGASVIQVIISIVIVSIGMVQLFNCDEYRYGDWGQVYGGFLVGCSFVAAAATYGRQRLAILLSECINSVVCWIALGVDGWSYFCVDLYGGANRETRNCPEYIEAINACQWMHKWQTGTAHFRVEGAELRKTLLVLFVMNFVFGVSILTMALTEAGRNDLCQLEDALRHLKEANEQLDYRKRARRNRILTRYVSQAKSDEGQAYRVKMLQFLGFNNEVEPIPVENRKVKLIAPPPKQPESV